TTISSFTIQSSSADSHSGAQISTPGYATTGWYPAGPRSTVYAALVADGVDPDPFFSTNMQSAGGNFSVPWWYRADFTLPTPVAATTMVDFSGVISSADVWVNGTQVATNAQVAGAYTDHELNLTSLVHPGTNTIAFLVQPNNPDNDLTLGWIDWNPQPPDNNMGIFRDVVVRQSGGVDLRLPDVQTTVAPSLASAQLTVSVQARNDTASPVNATVAGTIGPISFSQTVALAANSSQVVSFTPAGYPQLTVSNPSLWWPAGMGGQPLYTLGMTASISSVITDSVAQSFGVRDLQAPVESDGFRHFIINGRPVLIRGAGWSPDILLRSNEAALTAKMQYVVDLGLNAIRLEGHLDTPDFYDLADRLGILLLPGWECCDKWQNSGSYSSADTAIASASMTSEAQDLRNHPSVVAFFIGSDTPPSQSMANTYVSDLTAANWPDAVISSVNDFSPTDGLGPTGVKEPGPYDWVPPVYWYNKATNGHDGSGGAFGFDTEMSAGADIPPMYTLNKMMTPAQQQTLLNPGATQYHAGAAGTDFDNLQNFDNALFARYGTPATVAQYDAEAQLANYEATRAQYEAYDRNFTDASMPSTGLIYWQLTSAWTSLHWQLFDAYLDQGGAYYGVKKANEALHVQYSYDDRSVAVIDQGPSAASGLTVHADVYNLDGTLMNSQTASSVSVPGGGGNARPLTIPASIPGLSTTYLVRLTLTDASGTQIDRNVYWLSTAQDVLNYAGSTYAITPTTAFANLTGLESMGQTSVSATAATTAGPNGWSTTTVVVTNNSSQKVPAFFLTLQMMANGNPVLPEQWSDNELSLWPGESETVTASYQTSLLQGTTPSVSLSGWNTGTQTIPAAGGGSTGTAPAFSADTPPATATVGSAYSYTFTASGSPAPTFSVASGALPAGLALSAAGVLSGTPTVTGTATFTVSAANSAGSTTTPSISITVGSGATAPAFLADTPPASAMVGAPYSYTFTASGTPAPTFSVAGGSLPAGLALSAAGVLSGTPTATGTATFTVRAANSAGSATTPQLSISVAPAPVGPVFTAATPPATATVGTPYSYTFAASGSPAPTFGVGSGTLPGGLGLSAAGVLSGTPTTAGAFSFSVAASNSGGTASAGPFTVTVSPATSAPVFTADTPPPSAMVGTAYSYTFTASGSPAPTFAVHSGAVPPGLGLSAGGVLSGSPTTAGVFAFSVSASNTAGSVTSPAVTVTVSAAPAFPVAAGSVFAQDTFARGAVTGGWGTATDGHAWALQSGAASVLSVAGNQGLVKGSGSMATARLTLGTG
ncbi:MAG TPA: putative Ig domain-containing protein, partial [Actinomycetota bacterium]|nr:putative Ig domain-containing protein [Actinomycetota bacterium]